jgi:hypothetical protein
MSDIKGSRRDVPLFEVVEHIVGDLDHLAVLQRTTKIAAWDRALKNLIDAVSMAKLKAKGRGTGNQLLEEISPGDFAEVASNPLTDFDIGYGGKCVLEFNADNKATIIKSHSIGSAAVLWTDVCAESGAEVLKLWPTEPPGSTTLNATEGAPREESKPLPPLQERILEISHGLWPDGKLPPRIADRDNQILNKWPHKEHQPDRKTIQRAFKNWTLPDK